MLYTDLLHKAISPRYQWLSLLAVWCLMFVACPRPVLGQELNKDVMERMRQDIFSTKMPVGRIPPISNPQFIDVRESSLSLEPDDAVFILEAVTPPRIYPARVLVWHEVVYDQIPNPEDPNGTLMPIAITYSPLTGSIAAYKLKPDNSSSLVQLHSSGTLLYGNSVLSDQTRDNFWSQLLGACFNGDCVGQKLTPLPLIWTTWELAKKAHKDALVLSRNTGYKRTYGEDPYMRSTKNPNPPAPLPRPLTERDLLLPLKQQVLGIVDDYSQAAVDIEAVRKVTVLNFMLGITPLVAFYDKTYDTARIFNRQPDPDDPPLVFSFDGENFRDDRTNSEWNEHGEAVRGRMRETKLTSAYATYSMWFAWFAFHPNTILITEEKEKAGNSPPLPAEKEKN